MYYITLFKFKVNLFRIFDITYLQVAKIVTFV